MMGSSISCFVGDDVRSLTFIFSLEPPHVGSCGGLFECPVVASVGMAVAMRRKKSAAMPPEPGPDLFPVGLRQVQTLERGAGEELKTAFGVVGRQCFQTRLYLEQKHQPVRPALEAVFADEAGQVQIFWAQRQAGFLMRFAAGADVGRLTDVHF